MITTWQVKALMEQKWYCGSLQNKNQSCSVVCDPLILVSASSKLVTIQFAFCCTFYWSKKALQFSSLWCSPPSSVTTPVSIAPLSVLHCRNWPNCTYRTSLLVWRFSGLIGVFLSLGSVDCKMMSNLTNLIGLFPYYLFKLYWGYLIALLMKVTFLILSAFISLGIILLFQVSLALLQVNAGIIFFFFCLLFYQQHFFRGFVEPANLWKLHCYSPQ